jgi:NADH dehydrogenase/NADH:ubiquinone oxidoreductase subunit G
MSETLKVTINGKVCEAQKGEYILEVARRNKIPVPSFCHHEALPGLGCCRLCVVEVSEGGGKPRVVVSCVYPVSKDCEVYTESEKIKGIRRTILSMLRGRAPDGSRIASLCDIHGVPEEKRYTTPAALAETGDAEKRLQSACILCGLCVEACSKMGTGAISSTGRGTGKKISTPYDEASPDCVGCASCAAVCPTGAIVCDEDPQNGRRSIWGKTFNLVRCAKCGKPFATTEEIAHAAARLAAESGAAAEHSAQLPAESGTAADTATAAAALCETCRRKKGSDVMAAAFGVRV